MELPESQLDDKTLSKYLSMYASMACGYVPMNVFFAEGSKLCGCLSLRHWIYLGPDFKESESGDVNVKKSRKWLDSPSFYYRTLIIAIFILDYKWDNGA
jgi:hypothetical protein